MIRADGHFIVGRLAMENTWSLINATQCNANKIILPAFDNWREWLILLQSTRMVDSGIFIAKIGWFYPNRESTFWAMHAILAMRNNKMGHRINKMWTLINKVGHRNVKLVDTYQQLVFKKQQNGSRVLYRWNNWLFTHGDKFKSNAWKWFIFDTLWTVDPQLFKYIVLCWVFQEFFWKNVWERMAPTAQAVWTTLWIVC